MPDIYAMIWEIAEQDDGRQALANILAQLANKYPEEVSQLIQPYIEEG